MRKLSRCYESGHVVYSWAPYLYEGLLESISRRFLFSESSDKSSSTGATWRIRQNNQYCTTLVYSFTKTALNIQVLNLTQITKIPVKQMNIVTCNIRETYTWHCFILLFIYDFISKYINLFSSTWISTYSFFLTINVTFIYKNKYFSNIPHYQHDQTSKNTLNLQFIYTQYDISSTFREVLISINNKLVQHRVARMMVNDSKPKIPIWQSIL